MGLSSLSSALSGLSIAQRQIDVISNNVANVGTEGYTRKILPQYTQTADGVSVGVRSGILGRNVNLNLSQSLWTQVSAVEFNNVQATYLNRISQFHGPPDKELSIAAELSKLRDSFSVLSDDPLDTFLQAQAVNQATDLSNKINEFSDLITTLRNDAQNEITDTVRQINNLLEEISNMNRQIRTNLNIGRSTATAEDTRDMAVKNLSELIDISFFKRGDGVMVVQTNLGAELVGDAPQTLTFDPAPLSSTVFYPDTAAGIYIGDPDAQNGATEITTLSPGGKLGGLITLRDETFPKQSAQLDELAHKLALRFEAQGLRLFTDETGGLPLDTPPDLTTDPETAVPYVGFADRIRVNQAILDNKSLLQTGTAATPPAEIGTNEVIRRVIDFTFGETEYQQAFGSIDLRVSLNGAPNNRLQEFLGIRSTNTVTGTRDLSAFTDPATFITATNGSINAGANTFRVTLEEPDLGLGPVNIDIDLSAVADGAGSLTQDIIDHINGVLIPALSAADQTALTDMNVQFTVGASGQLAMTSTGNITINATAPANPMGASNLALLGLGEGQTLAQDPYLDIGVGNNTLTRITIEPADTEVELLAKLQAVPGLAAQLDPATGELQLRPGNDFTNPEFGGDIKIVGGPFLTDTAGANAVFGAGTIVDDVNIVSSLFGSFNAGPPPTDLGALSNIGYQSQISATDTNTVAFREEFLGPGGNISTGILGSTTLADFAQKMVNEQTQELILVEEKIEDDNTFRDLLEDQILRESGVNLDEELSNLIVVQTAYAASARVVNVVDEMFQELLNAV